MEVLKVFGMQTKQIRKFLEKYKISQLEKIYLYPLTNNIFFDNFYLRIIKLNEKEYKLWKKGKKTSFPILKKLTLLKPKDEFLVAIDNIEEVEKIKLSSFHIFLTTECNLRCIYCFAHGGEKSIKISIKNAIAFIERLLDPNSNEIRIHFFGGGEPTLAIEEIKKIIEYLKKKYPNKKFLFSIQTNGVFNKKIRDFLIKNFEKITISCDGIPEIQAKQRPSPFIPFKEEIEKIEENIKEISKVRVVSIRATLTKGSLPKILDSALYFYKLGAKNIHFEPITIAGRALKTFSEYALPPDKEELIKNFIKLQEYAEVLGFKISGSSLLPFNLRFSGRFCGACGRNFCLTPDNFISTCYEVTNFENSPEAEIFIIGKLLKENGNFKIKWYKEKLEKLKKRTIYNMPNCRNCIFRYGCGGYCPIRVFRDTGDIFTPSKEICKIIKSYAMGFIEYHLKSCFIKTPYLKKMKNKYFIKWVSEEIGKENKINIIYLEVKIPEELTEIKKKIIKKIDSKKLNLLFLKPLFECKTKNYKEIKKNVENLIDILKNVENLNNVILPAAPPFTNKISCDKCWFSIKNIEGSFFTCDGKKINKKDIFNKNVKCIEKEKIIKLISHNKLKEECKKCKYKIRGKCNGISYCVSL